VRWFLFGVPGLAARTPDNEQNQDGCRYRDLQRHIRFQLIRTEKIGQIGSDRGGVKGSRMRDRNKG
jgi:hypothetical protein